MERRHTFVTLDALRGVAAICVVVFHFPEFFGFKVPHGYLAVDFFFMLSGFVLTYAYQERLDRNWSMWSFLKVRVIRLYPLYFLGLILGTIFTFLEQRYGSGLHLVHTDILILFVMELFFLPAIGNYPAGPTTAFPLNNPSWSLFDEMVANIFHALLLRRRSPKFLIVILLLSGVGFAWETFHFGSLHFGYSRETVLVGIVRVVFSYTLGSLLFHVWQKDVIGFKVSPVVVAIALLAAFMVPESWDLHGVIPLLLVAAYFPILLLFGSTSVPSGITARFAASLGTASYGLYVLHYPLGYMFEQVWQRASRALMEKSAPWGGLVFLALLIPFTLMIDKIYDKPGREALKRKLDFAGRQPPA